MLVAGWCVIKSSPVALYFPYCSSLSHLAYSGPQILECYKSLVFLSFLMLLKGKKWTFNPLDSTFYYYSCRLNLRPKNSSKIGKDIDREEETKVTCLSHHHHPGFTLAWKCLWCWMQFLITKSCVFRKYTVLRMCCFFFFLVVWHYEAGAAFRRM